MTNAEYRTWRLGRSIYPGQGSSAGFVHCSLGLANEAGEVAGEAKKCWRDDDLSLTNERKYKAALELGDTLWYLDAAAEELGLSLAVIMDMNMHKINRREEEKNNGRRKLQDKG